MALGGRELRVILTSDVGKFGSGLRKAERDARSFGGVIGKVGKAAALGLAGVAAAAGTMAVSFAVDGVQGAIAQRKELATLHKALENLGFGDAADEVDAWIDKTAQATLASDSELRPALAKLLTATRDLESAQRLLGIAQDLSAQSGVSLESAVNAVAKAQAGSFTSLKKLLPGMESLKDKTPKLTAVMDELARITDGAAATAADSLSGRMQQLGEDVDELKESFGEGLLTALDDVDGQAGGLSTTLQEMGPTAEDLGKSFGDIAVGLAETLTYLGPVVEKFNELNDMGDGIITNGSLVTLFGKIVPGVKVLAGTITGNDQAVLEARTEYEGGSYTTNPNAGRPPVAGQSVNPNATGNPNRAPSTYFDPARYLTQQRHATSRADARSAQKGARTNARP